MKNCFIKYRRISLSLGILLSTVFLTTSVYAAVSFDSTSTSNLADVSVDVETTVSGLDAYGSISDHGYLVTESDTAFGYVEDADSYYPMEITTDDYLLFTSTHQSSVLTKYSYWKLFDGDGVVLNTGDTVEYDVYMLDNTSRFGAIDIRFSDGIYSKADVGWVDQNGVSCHPDSDISSYAFETWFTRKCTIPVGLDGKTVSWINAANRVNSYSTFQEYFDNFIIRDSSGDIKYVYYTTGDADYSGTLDYGSKAGTSSTVTEHVGKASDTTGVIGRAVAFVGVATGLEKTLSGFDTSGGYSINFWANIDANDTDGTIFNISNSESDTLLAFKGASSNSLFFRVIDDSVTASTTEVSDAFVEDSWINVGITSSVTGDLSIYVNGVSEYSGNIGTFSGTLFDEIFLGGGFKGEIDEVKFWEEELSSEDIEDLYNDGNGYSTEKFALGSLALDAESFSSKVDSLNFSTKYYISPYIYTDQMIIGDAVNFTTLGAASVTVGTTTGDDDVAGENDIITGIVYDDWVDIEAYGYLLNLTTADFVGILQDYMYVGMDEHAGGTDEHLDFVSDNVAPSVASSWKALDVGDVVIQEGDTLSYDVYLYEEVTGRGSIRVSLTDTSTIEMTDQYDLSCASSSTDISEYAFEEWFSRTCTIAVDHIGKTISYLSLVNGDPTQSPMHVLYDNIIIRDIYGNIKKTIYTEGEPDYTSEYATHGHISDAGTVSRGSVYSPADVYTTNSVKNNSYEFNGDDESLRVDTSSLDFTNGYSLAFWLHTPSSDGIQNILDFGGDVFMHYNPVLGVLNFYLESELFMSADISFGADEWKHIAISHDTNDLIKIYIDGVETSSNTLDYPFITSPDQISFGGAISDNNTGGFYEGLMDELFIFESVISTDEIDILADNGATVSAETEIVYLTDPLDESSFDGVVENLGIGLDYILKPFVLYGNQTFQLGSSFSFTTLSSGSMTFGTTGNSDVVGNHADIVASITYDNWVSVNQYGYFIEKSSSDFSVIRNAVVRVNMDAVAGDAGEYLDFKSDNNNISGGSSWKAFDLASIEINSGDVLKYDVYLFEDGSERGSVGIHLTDTSSLPMTDQEGISCGTTADISAYAHREWYSRECTVDDGHDGSIADLIYFANEVDGGEIHVLYDNIVLEDSEGVVIETIYETGSADYSSTYLAHGHVWDTGKISTVAADHIPTLDESYSVLNNSYEFNGSNDFVDQSVADLDLEDGYSISLWLSTTAVDTVDTILRMNEDMFFLNDLDAGNLQVYINDENHIEANIVFVADEWKHIVISQNSEGLMKIYIDGVEISSETLGYINLEYLVLGVGTEQGDFYNGWMDELSLYGSVLSDEEIEILYNSGSDVASSVETVYIDDDFVNEDSFDITILDLDAQTEYSIKPFVFYGNNKFAVGEYTTFTTGGINETPETGHDQITFSTNFYAGQELEIGTTYIDANGGEDMDKLYLQLKNPDGEDIEYYITNAGQSVASGSPTAISGDEYMEDVSYSLQHSGNDLIVTWTFRLDWDWTESSNIQIGIRAIDHGELETNYEYTTTKYTYENDLAFYGTLTATGSESGNLANGQTVYTSETVLWSGIKVVYQGTSNRYPPDSAFDVILINEDGDSWLDTNSSGRNISITETLNRADSSFENLIYIINTPDDVEVSNAKEMNLRVSTYVAYTPAGEDPEDESDEEDEISSEIEEILEDIRRNRIQLHEEAEVTDIVDLDEDSAISVVVLDSEVELNLGDENTLQLHEEDEVLISTPVTLTGLLGENEEMILEFNDDFYVMILNKAKTHYEATISTKGVKGSEVLSIYVYDTEAKLATQAYTVDVEIDPYGYVYSLKRGQQVRVTGAEVTLYTKTTEGEWIIYSSETITNPQETDEEGSYSFYVIPGKYMLKVKARWYEDYASEEFEITDNTVEYNVEMVRNSSMYVYMSAGVLLSISILLYLFWKKKKEAI